MGRLVITHSTYLDGLIPLLRKLSVLEGIKTITPGIIKRVNGNSENLNLKITRQIKGGYRVIARKGKSMQEVFVICNYKKEELDIVLMNLIK